MAGDTTRWRAVMAALCPLDAEQAEVVLGPELMQQMAESVTGLRGEVYAPGELHDAANMLLLRRPA